MYKKYIKYDVLYEKICHTKYQINKFVNFSNKVRSGFDIMKCEFVDVELFSLEDPKKHRKKPAVLFI